MTNKITEVNAIFYLGTIKYSIDFSDFVGHFNYLDI